MMLAALPGHPLIIVCNQKPVAPVSWSIRHMQDSEAQHIVTEGSVVGNYTDRFGIHGSNLIIYKVQERDSGLYDCSDAAGEMLTSNVTVVGKKSTVAISNVKCKKT